MKVYILFKVKDMSKRKKEWVVDNLYTDIQGVLNREDRLHRHDNNCHSLRTVRAVAKKFRLNKPYKINIDPVLKSEVQQTFWIVKPLKGKL